MKKEIEFKFNEHEGDLCLRTDEKLETPDKKLFYLNLLPSPCLGIVKIIVYMSVFYE